MAFVSGLRHLVLIVLLGLLVVFAVQNAATVEVTFLAWSISLPRAVLYAAIFALGVIFGALMRLFGGRHARGDGGGD